MSILIITGVKLGHMKNALFGVLTIAMYTTPKSAFFIRPSFNPVIMLHVFQDSVHNTCSTSSGSEMEKYKNLIYNPCETIVIFQGGENFPYRIQR